MASSPSTAIQRLTESGLARQLDVSRQAVHDLVKRGILSKDKDGLIDAEMAKIALANRVRPPPKPAAALTAPAPNATTQAPAATAAATDGTDTAATSYHVAKTLRETAEARMAQIKLAQLKGQLLPLEKAQKAAFEIGRQVRDALNAATRRIAPELATAATVTDCEEILRREHAALLQNLSTALAKNVAAPSPDTTEATP